jgi:hypothetical protein
MERISLDSIGAYDLYLRGQHHGKTSKERLETANAKLDGRLRAIEQAKKRQMNWIIAGYGFAAVMSFYSWGNTSGEGMAVALFMNIAAYQYGKLQFQPEAELHAFNQAVDTMQREEE